MILKIKKLRPSALLPRYAHPGEDAAFDLFACDWIEIKPGCIYKVPLGIACEFSSGYFAHVMGRSGLAAKGIVILGGVIDSGYRGEWHVQLSHLGAVPIVLEPGDKIAQCVISPAPVVRIDEVDDLQESQRGCGGFGSTDKK